ncbi:MAG: hypothetical protein ACOZAO_03960 [Patescibacteria group bacterium]
MKKHGVVLNPIVLTFIALVLQWVFVKLFQIGANIPALKTFIGQHLMTIGVVGLVLPVFSMFYASLKLGKTNTQKTILFALQTVVCLILFLVFSILGVTDLSDLIGFAIVVIVSGTAIAFLTSLGVYILDELLTL